MFSVVDDLQLDKQFYCQNEKMSGLVPFSNKMKGTSCALGLASIPWYRMQSITSSSLATNQIKFGKLINGLWLELVAKDQFPGITFFEQENRLPPQE